MHIISRVDEPQAQALVFPAAGGGWVLRFARGYTLNQWPEAAELVCVMDLYTQIQDKLHDLSKRFAHEAR